jgi:four helix bundle protein
MFESLTLDKERVADTADALRVKVLELSEDDRRSFYRLVKKKIKDPDTYAVLNWLVLTGLHHFYLGQWLRGTINFEEIEGWKLGRELTKMVYSAVKQPQFAKDYGLKDQVTRASGSVMHNVAEGFDGGSNAEFIKFLRYAQRSASEVQSQLYVALDQDYISREEFQKIYSKAQDAHSKIGGFINYLLKLDRK